MDYLGSQVRRIRRRQAFIKSASRSKALVPLFIPAWGLGIDLRLKLKSKAKAKT